MTSNKNTFYRYQFTSNFKVNKSFCCCCCCRDKKKAKRFIRISKYASYIERVLTTTTKKSKRYDPRYVFCLDMSNSFVCCFYFEIRSKFE